MKKSIGRFELLRELGRGAQSVVYLCNDPHLQREVAIKTLHFSQADPRLNAHLLAEARTVSKLRHASIVPIFEAGEQDGDPYLVFEYVEGKSLAQVLEERLFDPLSAAGLIITVLDALSEAHAQGIIHRDLKPSNIIIDTRGGARVMDFGIAVRAGDDETAGQFPKDALMGTPAYMAPEYVRERIINEQTDLYAVGLILIEMLTGCRARTAKTLSAMLESIANEPVRLPDNLDIDGRMGGIILKAVAQDAALRFHTAAQMSAALREFVSPPLNESSAADAGSGSRSGPEAAVDFLLRRMKHKSDFPALSDSVSAINRLTNSDKDSINKLSNTILKDFALTAKILRIVNSPFYRSSGGGTISTVSRAVIVLGFDTIRNVVLTVMMFEHLQNKANAGQIKESFLRANLSGLIGREIGQKLMPRDAEEAFVCAMFHDLGRLLVQFYFPDEIEEIQRLVMQRKCSEEAAVLQVLGMSFDDLGAAIAHHWGFPPSVINSMRSLSPGPVRKPSTREEMLRTVAGLSNEICERIATEKPGASVEGRSRELKLIVERYAAVTQFSDAQLKDLTQKAVSELDQIASSLQINLKQSAFARQARAWSHNTGVPAAGAEVSVKEKGEGSRGGRSGAADELGSLSGFTVEAANASPDVGAAAGKEAGGGEPARGEAPGTDDIQAVLAAGIQDISNSLVDDFSLNDILRIILETMYRAMGFGRVLLCLRDARTNTMIGRFGFGSDTTEIAKHFRFSLTGDADVFRVAAQKGVDLIISDINEPNIRSRIPEWYRTKVASETFVLFPMVIKGVPVAMIYCDRRRAGEIKIPERELNLLRTLRNQAVLAIKQAT